MSYCFLYIPAKGNDLGVMLLVIGVFAGIWILSVISRWVTHRIWKGKARMKDTVKEFGELIEHAMRRMQLISEVDSGARPAPEKWSKKEILGHLIDSASNNHQRFVRAQHSGEIRLPGYEQERWVQTQVYQDERWENLLTLWKFYNLHLLHIISHISEERLKSHCYIGDNPPVTLEFIVTDYIRHLRHHLDQIS